ncbi:MAG: hypothetical protein WDW36_003157 [Sanguina aurantia]
MDIYAGKSQTLAWVGGVVDLKLSRIEQLASGAVYCQLVDAHFPDVINISKVNFLAREEYECLPNYKLMQGALSRLEVTKDLDVGKLSKGSSAEHLELLQWMLRFLSKRPPTAGYQASARRRLSVKGGTDDVPFPAAMRTSSDAFRHSSRPASMTDGYRDHPPSPLEFSPKPAIPSPRTPARPASDGGVGRMCSSHPTLDLSHVHSRWKEGMIDPSLAQARRAIREDPPPQAEAQQRSLSSRPTTTSTSNAATSAPVALARTASGSTQTGPERTPTPHSQPQSNPLSRAGNPSSSLGSAQPTQSFAAWAAASNATKPKATPPTPSASSLRLTHDGSSSLRAAASHAIPPSPKASQTPQTSHTGHFLSNPNPKNPAALNLRSSGPFSRGSATSAVSSGIGSSMCLTDSALVGGEGGHRPSVVALEAGRIGGGGGGSGGSRSLTVGAAAADAAPATELSPAGAAGTPLSELNATPRPSHLVPYTPPTPTLSRLDTTPVGYEASPAKDAQTPAQSASRHPPHQAPYVSNTPVEGPHTSADTAVTNSESEAIHNIVSRASTGDDDCAGDQKDTHAAVGKASHGASASPLDHDDTPSSAQQSTPCTDANNSSNAPSATERMSGAGSAPESAGPDPESGSRSADGSSGAADKLLLNGSVVASPGPVQPAGAGQEGVDSFTYRGRLRSLQDVCGTLVGHAALLLRDVTTHTAPRGDPFCVDATARGVTLLQVASTLAAALSSLSTSVGHWPGPPAAELVSSASVPPTLDSPPTPIPTPTPSQHIPPSPTVETPTPTSTLASRGSPPASKGCGRSLLTVQDGSGGPLGGGGDAENGDRVSRVADFVLITARMSDQLRRLSSTQPLDGCLKALGLAHFGLLQALHREMSRVTASFLAQDDSAKAPSVLSKTTDASGVPGTIPAAITGGKPSAGGSSGRRARVFRLGDIQLKQLRNGDTYKGAFSGTKKNGDGLYEFVNQDVYEGSFRDDRMDGVGVYTFSHEGRYEGHWKNAVYNGCGTETFAKGSTYHGEYAGGLRNGWGACRFYNSDYYEGQWANGLRDGRGMQQCTDDSNYVGEYVRGKRHGCGVYSFPNGDRYVGQYYEDLPHGTGVYFFASGGQQYRGQWKAGRKHGWSVYSVDGGCKFAGQWAEGKPQWVQPLAAVAPAAARGGAALEGGGDDSSKTVAASALVPASMGSLDTETLGDMSKEEATAECLAARQQANHAASVAHSIATEHWQHGGWMQRGIHCALSAAKAAANEAQECRAHAKELAQKLDKAVAALCTSAGSKPLNLPLA